MNENENTETNETTTNTLELLSKLKREVFGGDDGQLALALGRPESEISAWFTHGEEIDEDAEMKIIGLAQERLSE